MAMPSRREQDMQAPIAEAPAMAASSRRRARTARIVRPAAAVAHRRAIGSERRTRPPLAHLVRDPTGERRPLASRRASPFF